MIILGESNGGQARPNLENVQLEPGSSAVDSPGTGLMISNLILIQRTCLLHC